MEFGNFCLYCSNSEKSIHINILIESFLSRYKTKYRTIIQVFSALLFLTIVADHVINGDSLFANGNATAFPVFVLEIVEEQPIEEEALTSPFNSDDCQKRMLSFLKINFISNNLLNSVPTPPPDIRFV